VVFAAAVCSCAESPFVDGWNEREIQPVECHLRLVDQSGKPVSRAKVEAAVVIHKSGNTGAKEKPLDLITDGDGRLDVVGEKGGALWFRIDDPAFAGESTQANDRGGFSLSYYKIGGAPNVDYGTMDRPRIFQVWRKEGPQPLVSLAGQIDVQYAEAPIRIDLVKGEIVDEGGDIILTIKQPLDEKGRDEAAKTLGEDQRRLGIFPWSCEVSLADGGFYEVDQDEFDRRVFGVFERSMENKKTFSFSGLGNSADLLLVMSARAGKLNGKLHLKVMSGRSRDAGKIHITISGGLLNSTGSRSLELDPTRITKLVFLNGHSASKGP
jgi:hypothetical protein